MIEAIIATLNHARNQTLKLVADLSDEQLVRQPAPNTNHPAWVLGHLLQVEHTFLNLLVPTATAPLITDAWKATYGGGSTPSADRSLYQPKAFYLEKLAALRTQIIEKLRTMSVADLDKPNPFEARRERFPTVGHQLLLYGTWHEAYHAGQLSTWRRVQGLPPV